MSDLPGDPGSSGGTGTRPGSTEESTPRWVKVFGIIGLGLVLLMFIALLTGHGPGRHMPHGHRHEGPASPAAQNP